MKKYQALTGRHVESIAQFVENELRTKRTGWDRVELRLREQFPQLNPDDLERVGLVVWRLLVAK